MKQRVDMRIDVELLERVDEARGLTTRTAFTEQALRHLLEDNPLRAYGKPAESRTSPQEDLARKIKQKMAQGKTSKLAEIEAREELGL